MRRKLLSISEKQQVLQQRPYCFICEERVSEADLPELEFDHIVSLDADGSNDLTNYAVSIRNAIKVRELKALNVIKRN